MSSALDDYTEQDAVPDAPAEVRQLAAAAEPDERQLAGAVTKVTMTDGTEFTVRITNRDYVAWDRTAPRKKWGKAEDVPFLAATFMAWTAARREGKTSLPFDQAGAVNWVDSVDDIDSRQDDQDGDDVARPTRQAHAAD